MHRLSKGTSYLDYYIETCTAAAPDSHHIISMVITHIFLLIQNIHSVVSFQADEPIADYAAMDDVYQGKCRHLHLHYVAFTFVF